MKKLRPGTVVFQEYSGTWNHRENFVVLHVSENFVSSSEEEKLEIIFLLEDGSIYIDCLSKKFFEKEEIYFPNSDTLVKTKVL